MSSRFDFDSIVDRRNSGSYKWDDYSGDPDDMIQLWVADMDFRTAPAIIEALRRRVDHGVFGYTFVPNMYYAALTDWFRRRHGYNIDRSKVIYTSGVVPAMSAVIKALTVPGEGVILNTPAYNCFFSSIRNNGCRIVESPLRRIDLDGGEFTYEIDFEALDSLASHPDNKLFILCNPHNPTGRVWRHDELERIAEICSRNGVRVISDEIHCELTLPGTEYLPYGNIDGRAVICNAPSKAFNTAGLQIANIVCPDDETRAKIDKAININEVCDVNPFGVAGLIAAYNEGEEWLDDLRIYLEGNYRLIKSFFADKLSSYPIARLEATYLAWVDITASKLDSDEIENLLADKAHVRVASGSIYGDKRYIRINFATPRTLISEALHRIEPILNSL
ncbi:MAG: pyridoxal phosphate-dependent aminotransferase [Muribaculaceae bacterium]|nr:pyridoxal phosphate-dependent aminotransferase [Muribaculaceae bacterium]